VDGVIPLLELREREIQLKGIALGIIAVAILAIIGIVVRWTVPARAVRIARTNGVVDIVATYQTLPAAPACSLAIADAARYTGERLPKTCQF
jgi:hypothetical protein